jgi:uncharacterized NAD(P)/FAD-binding protein YdhS
MRTPIKNGGRLPGVTISTSAGPPVRVIAIVGGGCAGTLVAVQLLRQASVPIRVILIERSPPFGRGIAYGTECPQHLLNVPAARMSALPEDPGHFLRWAQRLAGFLGYPETIGGDDFLPRSMFGRYLGELLEETRAKASSDASLETITGEVVNLEEHAEGAHLTLADGRTLDAGGVVLALGNLPGEYPIRRPLPFYRSTRYVHAPLLATATNEIGANDDVLIVGAGLTAVDIAVQFSRLGHKGVVHALSRRGLRPLAHQPPAEGRPPHPFPGALPSTVREAFGLIKRSAAAFSAAGGDWRAVIDLVRPDIPRLWQGFDPAERARFMRHVRPYWEVHRHRIAPATAALITEMEAAGHLKFYAGRLVSLEESGNAAEAVIRERGRATLIPLRVRKVLNCTGPRTDYSKYQHPLLVNLLAAGLIGHDPLALGIKALPTGEVLRPGGSPVRGLFSLGAPLKGILWESTAVPEIRVHAAEVARRLLLLGLAPADGEREEGRRRPVPA